MIEALKEASIAHRAVIFEFSANSDPIEAELCRSVMLAVHMAERMANTPPIYHEEADYSRLWHQLRDVQETLIRGMQVRHAFLSGASKEGRREQEETEAVERRLNREQHPINDPKVRAQVLDLTGGRCAYCDVELVNGGGDAEQFCVEHVIPASKGGPNHLVNYVPSCRTCNNSKRDNHVLLFIRQNLPRRASNVVPMTTPIPAEAAE